MDGAWVQIACTHSAAETRKLAGLLAPCLLPGSLITLDGDLGAGKTQFVQGLASALGVVRPVTSPTFNLVYVYEGMHFPIYHFDVYRLDEASQLEDIDFYGQIESGGVACVEWASKFMSEMPAERLELYFARLPEEESARAVWACCRGAAMQQVLQVWQTSL